MCSLARRNVRRCSDILLCTLAAGLFIGTPAANAQTTGVLVFSTAWGVPGEALITGPVPPAPGLVDNFYNGSVGVSAFDSTHWGTLVASGNQINWTTRYTLDASQVTLSVTGGYSAGIEGTQLDQGSTTLVSPGNVTIGSSGTGSWNGFPTNPSGTGVITMPIWWDVNVMTRGPLDSGESTAMSGLYTGIWSVTYVYTPNNVWTGATGGSWSGGGGWGPPGGPPGTPPNAECASAYFGPNASTYVINLDVPVTLGLMHFDSSTSYTINGPETLTLQCHDGANVMVTLGSHTINAPIHVASNTTVTVSQSSDTLTTAGVMTSEPGVAIDKRGPGTWLAKHVRADSLSVQQGTVKMITDQSSNGTSVVKGLTVNDVVGAKLDLAQNHLVVDYATGGTSPYSEIERLIKVGYNGGNWGGAGITSSSAASISGRAIGYAEASALGVTGFGGQTVDSSSVLVRYTLAGDANLDGTVNFADLVKLSQNYNQPGTWHWSDGDFNYDGQVNFSDQVLLSQNYNTSLPPSGSAPVFGSAVPEPTWLSLFGALGILHLSRRRAHR
jgi:hypothetical protein